MSRRPGMDQSSGKEVGMPFDCKHSVRVSDSMDIRQIEAVQPQRLERYGREARSRSVHAWRGPVDGIAKEGEFNRKKAGSCVGMVPGC